MMGMESPHSYPALVVPKALVQKAKNALDSHGRLDKRNKVKPVLGNVKYELIDGDPGNARRDIYCIPVIKQGERDDSLSDLLDSIKMQKHDNGISLVLVTLPDAEQNRRFGSRINILAQAVRQWLQQTPQRGSDGSKFFDAIGIIDSYNWTYTIYPPLILLPSSFLSNLSSMLASSAPEDFPSLYTIICEKLSVSHIALNGPIPNTIITHGNPSIGAGISRCPETDSTSVLNVLRSPTGLTPLHGHFGPELPLDHKPTADDFASAFWCTAQQNGIFQTWAPRYVMFSRGNIPEKTRLLNLESLQQDNSNTTSRETSAVDLYAGIGYFAFSYARAGVGKVLCWEINPWSVEGLRRGAMVNKWNTHIIQDRANLDGLADNTPFLVFQEDNKHAAARIRSLRHTIPPIKHVNCGYLPSSKDSWEVAVDVLDPTGGWIHAHENVAKKDIGARKKEVLEVFAELVGRCYSDAPGNQRDIECEHVEQVKSYAPGIMHCVFDIAIMPIEQL